MSCTEVFLNIRDFGARGDGKSDDTQALLAAMDAATRDKGTVYFPSGTYCIHPVKVPSHITLMGNSSWGYSGRMEENGQPADPGYMGNTVLAALSGDARALLDLDSCCGTRIVGLTLDGRHLGAQMHGVYSRHGGVEQNNCYEDCRITRFTGCGLKLDWVWVFAVRRCIIIDNAQHGIDVDRGYDGWVIDNQISANGLMGINAGPGMVCYTGNRIEWNKEGGMFCNDTQNINVTGNSFDHNFGPAIWFQNSRANAVSGNMSRNDGSGRTDDRSCAFLLEDSQGISLTGNTVWCWPHRELSEAGHTADGTPYYGIVVKNLTDSVVSSNAMHRCASREVIRDLGGHSRTLIEGNVGSTFEESAPCAD